MPTILNTSILPEFAYLTEKRINNVTFSDTDILTLIRNLNPNKAAESDGISGQVLLLCDKSVVLPLEIIFKNILRSSILPEMWNLANVTPIFKKEDKQLVKNYRPISLLPICGKIMEKLIFNSLYLYLSSNNLITSNQSGFRPGDSCSNQLLFLINEIHKAFENPKSLELRAVFLIFPEHSIKYGMMVFYLSSSKMEYLANFLNSLKVTSITENSGCA